MNASRIIIYALLLLIIAAFLVSLAQLLMR